MNRRPERKISRPWWSKASAPAELPPGFYRLFGRRVDPETAKEVAAEVQREAIDRLRGETVETVVWRLAGRFKMCRAKVYEHLRAGRYLKNKERKQ